MDEIAKNGVVGAEFELVIDFLWNWGLLSLEKIELVELASWISVELGRFLRLNCKTFTGELVIIVGEEGFEVIWPCDGDVGTEEEGEE